MYDKIKIWQNKLEYLKDLQMQYIDLDKSWYDKDHWAHYNETYEKLEKKIKDYEDLVEYLKNSNLKARKKK